MVRGTFANVRLKNLLAPGTEGGVTRHLPDGEQMSIFDASVKYQKEGVPLLILAGKEYGSGSSRDWAAKGPLLLGVRAVIAESYERIHRSNLVGMGVLPLQFRPGENAASLGLTGEEVYDLEGLPALLGFGLRRRPGDHGAGRRQDVPGRGAHRHAAGDPLLPARRHPAIRAATIAGAEVDYRQPAAPSKGFVLSFPSSAWERTGAKLCFASARLRRGAFAPGRFGREAELRGTAFPSRAWERGIGSPQRQARAFHPLLGAAGW